MIEVLHARRADRKLAALPRHADRLTADLLAEAARAAEREAQRRAPVLSGELRDSIRRRRRAGGLELAATAAHAGVVEFGSSRQAAQPFMRPAVSSTRINRSKSKRKLTRFLKEVSRG